MWQLLEDKREVTLNWSLLRLSAIVTSIIVMWRGDSLRTIQVSRTILDGELALVGIKT